MEGDTDVSAITPTSPAAPAPQANPPEALERNLQDTSVGPSRAEIEFDEALNRVVGRVADETTGETIHEIPPKQPKAL